MLRSAYNGMAKNVFCGVAMWKITYSMLEETPKRWAGCHSRWAGIEMINKHETQRGDGCGQTVPQVNVWLRCLDTILRGFT